MYSKEKFPNQKEGEVILMFLRRHWIVIANLVAMTFFMALLPLLAYLYLGEYTNLLLNQGLKVIIILLGSAYYLFLSAFWFMQFLDYYLDVWIVTNMRIINIEQKGLFNRTVSEKDLGRMQDVTSEVKGVWETLFNYGNVHIQTAGEEQRFIFKQVPNAHVVARDISNVVEEYKKKYGFYYEDDIDNVYTSPMQRPQPPENQPPDHYHSY